MSADVSAALLPTYLHPFSRSLRQEPLPHFGIRCGNDGVFLPEPGNTVVCHLAAGSDSERAIVPARNRYFDTPEAKLLAFTPVSSLHMTLFQGIIEYRRRLPFWPSDVALDTPIGEMTAIFMDRLRGFVGGAPFRMVVTRATPTGLALEGASAADRAALKDWRERLAEVFGYRHPDHDSYSFHITFAYLIERFDDAALARWHPFLDSVVEDIRNNAGTIELRPPAFCSFEDMNHFEELRVLASA